MPVQAATHWDSLGHIFYDDKMYNGFDAREADCNGLGKLGIEHAKNKLVGRGVLLDIARFRGVDWLKDGEGISNDELDACAKEANVEIRRGDFVILRTGQMERCLAEENWGAYAGGDAPGLNFENCYWCQDKQIAGDLLRHLGRRGAAERDHGGSTSPGTGSSFRPWGSPWARCST